jgi:uncharacterized protein YdeI (YjbR/CyaY-like superfamily)
VFEPQYFPTEADFRRWLEANHATAPELLVGFWKKGSGKPSVDWPQARDQALCFGWIDGIRKRVDDERYTIRFTPRTPSSRWSRVNVARVAELTEAGLMHPAGLRAFEARTAEGTYSYEQRETAAFDPERERRLRANAAAAAFFDAQPPGYRRTATHWVMSAKREETRDRRLGQLIEDSAAARRIAPLARAS